MAGKQWGGGAGGWGGSWKLMLCGETRYLFLITSLVDPGLGGRFPPGPGSVPSEHGMLSSSSYRVFGQKQNTCDSLVQRTVWTCRADVKQTEPSIRYFFFCEGGSVQILTQPSTWFMFSPVICSGPEQA